MLSRKFLQTAMVTPCLPAMTQFPMCSFASKPVYPNLRLRNLKYKSMAKEKRKQARRESMGGIKSPKDTGEELPPFFLPPRYKLMFKIL